MAKNWKGKDMKSLYWLAYDLTVGFNFLKWNLGLSRKDIIRCWIKGECY